MAEFSPWIICHIQCIDFLKGDSMEGTRMWRCLVALSPFVALPSVSFCFRN